MSEGLAELVLSFADEEFVIDRGNVDVEARNNPVWFGFDPAVYDPKPVERALLAVGEHLRTRLAGIPWPVTFYAWYDAQAGQLRCSVASVAPDSLPFGGRHFVVESPRPVLQRMAAALHPGQILWEELTELPEDHWADQSDDDVFPAFPVFAMRVAG